MKNNNRKAMFAKIHWDKRYGGKSVTEKDLRQGVKLKRIPPQEGLEDLGLFHGQTTGYDVKKKRKVKIQNESLFLTKNNRLLIKGDSPVSSVTVTRFV